MVTRLRLVAYSIDISKRVTHMHLLLTIYLVLICCCNAGCFYVHCDEAKLTFGRMFCPRAVMCNCYHTKIPVSQNTRNYKGML